MALPLVLLVTFAVISSAAPAEAHAFAERYDLPLPLWYYLTGAAAVVAISFAAAGRLAGGSDGRNAVPDGWTWPLDRVPLWRLLSHPAVLASIRAASVAFFVVAVAAGFLGVQGEPLDNLLPVTVWVLWWVGVTYVSALVGDVWRLVNPIAVIAEAVDGLTGARLFRARWTLPPRAGVWWAVAFYLVFAWAEMAWPSNAVPVPLARAVLLYAACSWIGMAIVGIDVWLERVDPFACFFSLMARFSPIDLRRRVLRGYGRGLVVSRPATTSEMAFVLVVLASVGFDGLRETPWWNSLASSAMDGLYRTGVLGAIGNVAATALVKTLGLISLPLLFLAIYLAVSWLTARLIEPPGARTNDVARLFIASMVPVALAYHLAHYLSYLLVQGQAMIPLVSDPFGRGWNLFGTRGYEPSLTIVSARFVWSWALAAIVAGHVVAVFIAHVTARRAFGASRLGRASQYPMLVLMVAYTMLSLWILSQPIVEQS